MAPTSRSGQRSCWYARPPTVARPPSAASSPMMTRIVVDLPAPFGPRKPVTWPGRTSKLSRSTAVVRPYRLVRPWTAII
jgi:hypothetical protein